MHFLEREHRGLDTSERPTRVARVQVLLPKRDGHQLQELLVDLDQSAVVQRSHLGGKHSYIDSAYMQAVEEACRADQRIQAEIQTLGLPVGATVVIEPWAYGTDGMNDVSERITMVRIARPL